MNYITESGRDSFWYTTDIPVKIREDYRVYPHLAVMYVSGGSGVWMIGNESCTLSVGDLIFMSNLDLRRFVNSDKLKLECIGFKSDVFSGIGFGECLRVFYGRTPRFTHVVHSERLNGLFEACRRESLSEKPSFQLLFAYVAQLLIGASRFYDEKHPGMLERDLNCDVGHAVAIAASCAHIRSAISEELRVRDLARLCGMSERNYTRIFRKYVLLSPAEYIAHCRVKRFLTLYGAQGGNILETAFSCGFTSASGFYKCFHRICGMSPHGYKKELNADIGSL